MPFYIILALSAFLLTLLGTRLTILTLRKRTQPVNIAMLRERRAAVPTGGGIVVVFTLVIALLAADISYGLILAMLLLAAISFMHNLIDIPLPVRLIVQVMAVLIPLNNMDAGLFAGVLPAQIDKLVTCVLWVWFINIFSSMEKADGPCSIETISIATGLCLIAVFVGAFPSVLSIYSLIIAAAVTGFLWWNWPPAKILMGNVGSVPLSFLLGYLLLLAVSAGHHYTAIILPAYLLADGGITHLARLASPKKSSIPYYFEKALEHGRTPGSIARYIIGTNMLLVFLAMRCIIDPEMEIFNVATAYLCVFMLLGFFAHTPSPRTHDAR